MASRLAIFLFFFACIYIVFSRQEWKGNMYTSDSAGYYLYLPAVFIYHDIGTFGFTKEINDKYSAFPDEGRWFLHDAGDGKKNDKYAIGTCLFELPLFLVAHLYCSATGGYVADGFSTPYQWAGILSSILWAVAGLFVLRKFLLGYFTEPVTAITLLCISLATNLFYYTAYNQGSSHPCSFFLFSAVLYCTQLWYSAHRIKYIYILSLLLGLVVITRPVNIVVCTIPLLWNVNSLASLKSRMISLGRYKKAIAPALLIFLSVALLQLAYWKYSSGQWIYYSYKGEGFDLLHSKVWKGLFSYRKGWFVYTPVAFIALTAGLPVLWYKNKKVLPALIVFFILLIYVIFSWKNWWYGGSFGCRPLVESLAVLSIPLAALIERILSWKSILPGIVSFIVLAGCLVLNIFQAYQFSINIIHYDRMSRAYYWRVFGKTSVPPDYEKYLMDEHEYWKEITRISN